MKKLSYLFFGLLLLAGVCGSAAIIEVPEAVAISPIIAGGGVPVGGCTCSGSAFETQDAQNDSTAIGFNDETYYIGQTGYDPGTNREVCRIDVWINTITGDLTGKTFVVEVYTLSGTALNTLVGTTDGVAGASINATSWNQFDCATPFDISNGTDYAIAITMNTTDGSNFAKLYDSSGTAMDGALASWGVDKAQNATWATYDACFKLYACE